MRACLLIGLLAVVAACSNSSSDPADSSAPVVVEPTGPGRLVAATRLNTVSIADIVSAVRGTNRRLPSVTPVYEVANYRLTYLTLDAQGREIVASGLVSMPVKAAGARSPVLGYQHATTFNDAEAPSNRATADEPAVVFASLGYIVVAPDYIGYGVSKGTPHPYLLAAPSASAVIDLLTAARNWRLRNRIADNGQLFLMGYSEGGYATVAAHRALQATRSPHLQNLVKVVPGAGPYHVRLTLDALLDRVRNEIPVLGALITPRLLRLLSPPVRAQLRDALLELLVPADADVTMDPTILDNFLADDDVALEQQSNVHDWAPAAPTRFFHGRDDRTVPYSAATQTLQTMQALGASDVSLTDCPAVPPSHLGCVPPYLTFLLGELAAHVRDL